MSETTYHFSDFTNMPPAVAELPEDLRQGAFGYAMRMQMVGERFQNLKETDQKVFRRTAQGETLEEISQSYSPSIRVATLSDQRARALRILQISSSEIYYAALLHKIVEPGPSDFTQPPELSEDLGLQFYLGAIGVPHTDVASSLGASGNHIKRLRQEACREFGATTIRQAVRPAFACGYFRNVQDSKQTA